MNDTAATVTPPKKFYGWINTGILTFIYMATTGLVYYAFPVIFPMMLKDTGWGRGEASIAITVSGLIGGFLLPLAAKLLNMWGTRKVIIIGLAITLVNLLLLAFFVTELWHWILIWGIVIPVGRMLCGVLPAQVNIMFWFNRKRAMAMGLLMIGAPIGGTFAPRLFTWFMTQVGGWRPAWLLSAGALAVALLLSFLIKSKPSDLGQYPDGITPGTNTDGSLAQDSGEDIKTYRTKEDWKLKEVLKTKTIWFYYAAGIAQSMTLGLVVNHGVLHWMDVGYDKVQAATIIGVVIMASGFIRFPIGWLGDRVEPRWIYTGSLIAVLAGMLCVWKAPSYGLLMIMGPVYGMGYGAILVIGPTLLGNYYGADVYANLRSFFAPFLTVIIAAVPTVAGYVQESTGNYDAVFLSLATFVAVGVIFSFFLAPPQKSIQA